MDSQMIKVFQVSKGKHMSQILLSHSGLLVSSQRVWVPLPGQAGGVSAVISCDC